MTSRPRWARSVAAWIVVVGIALPLLYALLGSLQPEARLFGGGLPSLRDMGLDHYRALLGERDLLRAIGHSLVVAAATTAVCVSLGAASAYALARLRFPGRRALLACVLAVSMFPQISIVPPLYLLLRALGLIDTYPGLVLPYVTFAMPLTIWLLLGFFRQLPAELEEAARVDGAGRLRTLIEIVLPLSAPALATTALITFIYCWNEFLFALSFTLERKTLPVAIALLRGQYRVPWGEVLAAAIVSTAPIALLVLGFQRRIVQGLAAGAVKG
jgi:ABC-type glycerol-3-phosphate transport system permease component